ncbi:MAG: hypothetical protein WDZ89_03290 [Gemmatimonadota bacterium]
MMHAERIAQSSSNGRLFFAVMFWFSCLVLLLPGSLLGQERPIVSSEIAVSGAEATLRIEFADDGELVVAFRDGTVSIDGEAVGSYTRGDALDVAWRSLLGQAIAAEGAALSELLVNWQPPEDATGEAPDVIASTLDARLSAPPEPPAPGPLPADPAAPDTFRHFDGSVLGQLLVRPERLRELSAVAEGLSFNGIRIHTGESVTIGEDEVVRGTLLVVDGDAEILGRVEGNVVILGGTLDLHEGSTVTGDVRWNDGRVTGARDVVEGRIRRVQPAEAPAAAAAAAREQVRDATRRTRSFNPLLHIGRGIAGLFQNLISFAILALVGFGIIHFAGDRLDVVARTARRSAARSAAVGFAGAFLFLPVWILGMVALAISIIGIPALLAWIPLFPLAVGIAIVFGYMAIALNLGEWLAAQRFEKLPWLRVSNPFMAIIAGLGLLLVPFVVANVIQMGGPWLRAMQGLFAALGGLAGVIAATVGLGAVLLSRGGRRKDFAWVTDFEDDPDLDPGSWGAPRTPPRPGPASPGSAGAPGGVSSPGDSAGPSAGHPASEGPPRDTPDTPDTSDQGAER